jgi:cytochrome c peroxidase
MARPSSALAEVVSGEDFLPYLDLPKNFLDLPPLSSHHAAAQEQPLVAFFAATPPLARPHESRSRQERDMKRAVFLFGLMAVVLVSASATPSGQDNSASQGRRLFEQETFGGNGRTCRTCHSRATGTVSPQDAQQRFLANPGDPLFIHDGSDDGKGNGVTRILADATILMTIPLPSNVRLANSNDRFVVVRRGIPTTLNTPALDPVFMLDGRQPTLELQAQGAMLDHAQTGAFPRLRDLELIRQFQLTEAFFSAPALMSRAVGTRLELPRGRTESEQRGRRFFEDVPPSLEDGLTSGLCSHCHSGLLLNQTNEFASLFVGVPIPTGTRFANVNVSFFNQANNPVLDFIFNDTTVVRSPDPGRALVTGLVSDVDSFKISPLLGIRRTAPYFHDNSAKTLEDVAAHYARFFFGVTGGFINVTPQDEADMVALIKLLD